MAETKEKETPKVSASKILSKESDKKPASKEEKSKGRKKKPKHTHIEAHDNGSYTVRHQHGDGSPETSYAAKNLDEVHDGLEENMGEPNADEEQQTPPDQPQQQPPMQAQPVGA